MYNVLLGQDFLRELWYSLVTIPIMQYNIHPSSSPSSSETDTIDPFEAMVPSDLV
jgi:hypothetical protein